MPSIFDVDYAVIIKYTRQKNSRHFSGYINCVVLVWKFESSLSDLLLNYLLLGLSKICAKNPEICMQLCAEKSPKYGKYFVKNVKIFSKRIKILENFFKKGKSLLLLPHRSDFQNLYRFLITHWLYISVKIFIGSRSVRALELCSV